MSLTFSFDIGYASIGWCVLSSTGPQADPHFLGTGVVTFPTDDCLASKRRDLRRARRHIRSTRQRIERMKRWLVHRGVLTRPDLDKPGHPAPFLLAAASLQGRRTLSAWELWTVLRWYAHNRGYDGNSLWARGEEQDTEDTEKLSNARAYMRKYGSMDELRKTLGPAAPEALMPEFHTMAETVCACLNLDPAKSNKTISSHLPYKTLNAAYPRATVQNEVLRLLEMHQGKIPGLDGKTLDLLFTPETLGEEDRAMLQAAGIKLPKRYYGGLLFGQLVPRFDNRIISRCPVTWAKTYDDAIADGKPDAQARKLADKFAKVPAAKSKEFLEYRFARILANLKADGKAIDKELRQHLWDLAERQGRITHSDLEKAVKHHCGDVPTNLEAYFKLHPDSEEALVLDPVMDEVRKAEGSRAKLSPMWKHLSEVDRQAIVAEWKKGKAISLFWIAGQAGENPALTDALGKEFATQKPRKGESRFSSLNEYLQATRIGPKIPSGRAPYARPVLRQVVEEVRNGWDATKPNKMTDPENGEDKPANGVLYELGIPGSRVRQLQNERPLDQLTNNHLVRHRMLILERLLDDLAEEFVSKEWPVSRVVVEVARELSQFSGMTAKQIASELNSRLKDFKSTVDYLAKNAPDMPVNGSIIRKARIAMDHERCCPYTGDIYDISDLPNLDRDHIVPHADRNTNALHALTLTWPEVNKMKGRRTAQQFVSEDHGMRVPGRPNLVIRTPQQFSEWVKKHGPENEPKSRTFWPSKKFPHIDDAKRCYRRRVLYEISILKDKELGFTEGALTKTSHLMKLAMRGLVQRFPAAACDPVPGPVTAEIRKAWDLTGTLALACPEIIDSQSGETLPKNDIRGITHMHHALDAATIALAAHYFPLQFKGQDQKGIIWQILLKRNRSPQENDLLHRLGIFDRYRDKEGKDQVRLRDLPKQVKQALTYSLSQCRVAQHLPSDRSGAKAELTTWGVVSIDGTGDNARVKIRQKSSIVENGVRKRTPKLGEERAGKLLGVNPKNGTGKLREINGAMVIGENYGLALDPEPTVIPFHDVTARLVALREAHGGKPVRVLRNGMLIRVENWPGKEGLWRIMSCKASMKLDLARPQETKASWREVAIPSLLARGLSILPRRYTGHPAGQ
jgi:CRISPR-associated endonuclease Csn1